MTDRNHMPDPLADGLREDTGTGVASDGASSRSDRESVRPDLPPGYGRLDAPVGGPSGGEGGSPRRLRRGRNSSDRSFWEDAATVIVDRIRDGFEVVSEAVSTAFAGSRTRGTRSEFEMPPHASVKLPDDVAAAIAGGQLGSRDGFDANAWLGLTETDEGARMVAFEPGAERAWFVGSDGTRTELPRVHEAGVFAGPVAGPEDQRYRLFFTSQGHEWERHDTYGFGKTVSDFDVHLIGEGSHGHLDAVLGAHPTEIDGVQGVRFAVWAPNATRVAVVGSFNGFDERRHQLSRRGGVWEGFVPDAKRGDRYKFAIHGPDGTLLPFKADPFAFQQAVAPDTDSIVHGLIEESAGHGPGMQHDKAISIYEVHLGSWQRGEDDRILNYDEIAERLIPYVSEMGFTHIEFMPVSAHPFTGSWGYQPICLFAPDGRFGDPDGFRRLVDRAHGAGLGVIVDWVPAHFPSDEHGLAKFDGTALYEHPDPRKGFHKDWNTLIYDFGRPEVSNFLTANAVHWLTRYGVDALRVDAVASMLYLDYSREPGEWVPNVHGGRENLEAVALIHRFTKASSEAGRTTVAEESTAWPGVSRPIQDGGLGFDYKWNMGWMHDTLDYMAEQPEHRRHYHHKMTFGIHYGFTENFVLPISHDEVVHGKGSLIGKMPGDEWQRFANLRAYLGFMWTHPGKKLLFMGSEFAQEREWNHDRSLDWHLMDDAKHRGVNRLVRDLNHLYRDTPELHEMDCDAAGFAWIEGGDMENSVFSYERRARDGRTAVVIVNMTPNVHHDYRVGMPGAGAWREWLNTDAEHYGGSGVGNMGRVVADDHPAHGREASAPVTIPPLATLVFLRDPDGDAADAEPAEAREQQPDTANPKVQPSDDASDEAPPKQDALVEETEEPTQGPEPEVKKARARRPAAKRTASKSATSKTTTKTAKPKTAAKPKAAGAKASAKSKDTGATKATAKPAAKTTKPRTRKAAPKTPPKE